MSDAGAISAAAPSQRRRCSALYACCLLLFPVSAAAEEIREDAGELNVLVVVYFAAAFMLLLITGSVLHRHSVSIIPESLVAVGLGALMGFVFRHTENVHFTDAVQSEGVVNVAVLNLFLLPIIIFESGWSLQRRDFLSQLPYILLFAVGGTLIAMLVIGGLILATSDIHGIHQPRTAFAYAALISAVDPVATLATYSHLNVDPLLNVLVFGESVINDAVAIALFSVLNDPSVPGPLLANASSARETVLNIFLSVCGLLLGSIGLGLALGCVYILIMRFGRMRHAPASEVLFVFVSCFFTYALADYLGMSGIITVLFCGILMKAYATPHLTVEGRLLASFLLKQAASLADTAVFFFVGVATQYTDSHGIAFSGWVMLACVLGRIAATLPLGILTNVAKSCIGTHLPAEKRNMLSWKHLFMMCHAGLRGGIALMLVLRLGPWVDEIEGFEAKRMLRNATVVVICMFLLIFGGSTEVLLRCLRIPMGDEAADALLHNPSDSEGLFWRVLRRVHKGAVLPVLIGDRIPKRQYMHGGVVAAVLAEAAKAEAAEEAAAAEPKASRSQSSRLSPSCRVSRHLSVAERGDMFDLFGTADPASLQDMGDIGDALVQPAPRPHAPDQPGGESSGFPVAAAGPQLVHV